ncbi:hypothetical protein HanXRQr2_Chr06g0247491 [Helianthus annuus]|uniref:Uncharacterized protein n=1 Tax=Helianthus annuus TaxID=4232 RepID=A0A9K3NI69_HELAN|nr:hypothetical protein HanXRQr2_Chr06g0247491 [Helianthus annuus]KAJ0572673.1 hypothetical protein HanHA89_Chr06g0218301 [Helianthus annuus]
MRIVHFELSCVAVSGEPSVPLFRMFYRLQSEGDWFTFAKRKDNVSLPCYSFMPTSTYPKEWKNRFIFVSASLIPNPPPPLRDPKAVIDDSVPALSANKIVMWKRMYEHPTRAFNFPEGIFSMGGLSPLYPVRPKAYCEKKDMSLWSLLQADCKGVSFVVGGVVNPDMGNVLEGKTPDVRSSAAVGEVEKTPSTEGGSSERTKGSQNSPCEAVAKLDPNDGGSKTYTPKNFYRTGGVENVYAQKFLYENYIYNTTERKVQGVGHPSPPLLYFAPAVKNISGEKHEDLASRLSRKRKAGLEAGYKVVIPKPRNIRLRLRSASGQKSLPASRAVSEVPLTNTKGLFV